MKPAHSTVSPWSVSTKLAVVAMALAASVGLAADARSADVVFQKPSRPANPGANASGPQFRSPSSKKPQSTPAARPAAAKPAAAEATTSENELRAETAEEAFAAAAKPIATAPKPAAVKRVSHTAAMPAFVEPDQDLSGFGATPRRRAIAAASIEPWVGEPSGVGSSIQQAAYCDCGEPACGICDASCGFAEPGCGIIMEPGCAVMEPGCGLEPTCGCGEPDCGIVGCGSCVGNPGPDFWCFPVCLPRFKDLRFWAGVHGFKGPRDAPGFDGPGDGNFGFQEGVNIGGRAPLVSLLFPQLSYQLGYQAVQSHLSGTSDETDSDRSQQFVTGGVFRRVGAGVQFGVVWDMLRDDFQMEEDFHQLRYEISLKSRAGREFGFWGASHLNSKTVGRFDYQSVDQYCGFVRLHFRDGGALRFWGGATNDSEGLFGGDFVAPLNNRWSVQTGFNYLITDEDDGAPGAQEESWNVGINLVWHYGFMAKKGQSNPHAPLFPTADNGWMFVDQVP